MQPKGLVTGNLFEKNKEEREKKAEEFSEDSIELEKFLLYLWENNINTFACCRGHFNFAMPLNSPKPYILLDYGGLDNSLFRELLVKVLRNKDVEEVDISNDHLRPDGLSERKKLNIRLRNPDKTFKSVFENFFDSIEYYKNNISDKKNSNHEKEIEKEFNSLTDKQKEFINTASAIKELKSIDDISLEPYKPIYDKMPKHLLDLGISLDINKNEIRYEVDLDDDGRYYTNRKNNETFRVTGCSYTKVGEDYVIMNSKSELVRITSEEIKKEKLISIDQYNELKKELFTKNGDAFKRFVSYCRNKSQAENSNESAENSNESSDDE